MEKQKSYSQFLASFGGALRKKYKIQRHPAGGKMLRMFSLALDPKSQLRLAHVAVRNVSKAEKD